MMNPCIVYRYVDLTDSITKYIGITCKKHKDRSLETRIKEHYNKHKWAKGNYRIDYFIVNCQTDAEAFESHLISLYKTYNYYNKAKADWGVSSYLPIEIEWKEYITYNNDYVFSSQRREKMKEKICHNKNVDYSQRYRVWQANDGYWKSYVPDVKFKSGKRLIKKKKKDDLDSFLCEFYKRYT